MNSYFAQLFEETLENARETIKCLDDAALKEHVEILQTIEVANGEAAQEAMANHVVGTRQRHHDLKTRFSKRL